MNQPTIRVSPSELPKFNFLQYRNYLGEFKTEIDKARVRYNLGIPDSLSFKWGNIGGTIENQVDLIQLVRQSVTNQYSSIVGTLDTLSNKVNTLTDNILTLNNEKNNIQILNNTYKQELEQRLLELEREVSQNATLIKLTGVDGTVVDLSSVNSAISSLRERIAALESNPGTSYDLTPLQNQINTLNTTIAQLIARISNLEGSIGVITLESIQLSRNSVSGTLSSDKASVIVTATFSNGTTRNVTSECVVESSNTTVATWNNGIQFVGVGTAIMTFTYTYEGVTRTATSNISVSSGEESSGVTQYVGYAVDPSYVLGVPRFGTNTVAKIWTPENTEIEQAPVMGFWVCTTQNIATFSGSVGEYNLQDLYVEQRTYNGITYRIYMAGPVSEATTFNITI